MYKYVNPPVDRHHGSVSLMYITLKLLSMTVFHFCLSSGADLIIIIIIIIVIPNNKPYVIIRDNEKGTCMLIDVAISGDRNVIKKEAEKIL